MASAKQLKSNMVSKLYFRLLPMQVLLVAINAANGFISGLFAGNFVGDAALSAIGLFNPINLLITAIGMIMLSGTNVLCGKFIGRHQIKEMKSAFSLDILIISVAAVILTSCILILGLFDLTGFFTQDAEVRKAFDQILIGQAAGVFPALLGQQLFSFLSLEQQNKRTTIATVVSLVVNLLMNILFVSVLKLGTLGVALATAVSSWVFFVILAQYFFTKKALLKFDIKSVEFGYLKEILWVGLPGALLPGYQMVRGLIVNALIQKYVGPGGLSAFAASNSFLGLVWAVPNGMQVVDRILLSLYVGEEDRRSLTDVMRSVLFKCIPLMFVISGITMALAVPLTHIFLNDPGPGVFDMTVNAFRLLPLCMPFSVCTLVFVSYGQASSKSAIVHINTIADGVIFVAGFTAILIGPMGMNGFYLANILNGAATVLIFVIYAVIKNKAFPKNMDQLMVIPQDFGAPDEDRLDISIRKVEDVVKTAQKVQEFCLGHGVDERKAYYGALCLEEMAGNIVTHGFTKDKKSHTADVRVVYKNDTLILRVKDDCRAFDPEERRSIIDPEDPCKNIGIRMVYKIADEVEYQHLLGLNVLTMKLKVHA